MAVETPQGLPEGVTSPTLTQGRDVVYDYRAPNGTRLQYVRWNEGSSDMGIAFTVNGSHVRQNASPENALIARKVVQIFNYDVKRIPEGTEVHVSAYGADGAGAFRARAYQSVGFSLIPGTSNMYAIKRGGRLVPFNPYERSRGSS